MHHINEKSHGQVNLRKRADDNRKLVQITTFVSTTLVFGLWCRSSMLYVRMNNNTVNAILNYLSVF